MQITISPFRIYAVIGEFKVIGEGRESFQQAKEPACRKAGIEYLSERNKT